MDNKFWLFRIFRGGPPDVGMWRATNYKRQRWITEIPKEPKFFLYFFLLTSVLSGCAQVGTPSLEQPSKNERIDELFAHYTDSGEFSGAVLVAEEDQVLRAVCRCIHR